MHTPGIFHIPCICNTYSIHIAFILHITRIFDAYYFHIPYIFQASEPGTVFHVIPSAPPSPRAHSLPLSHVAFACTSRVATCSDLGQDGHQRLILTFLGVHAPCIFHAYSIHIPGFGTRNRFPRYSSAPPSPRANSLPLPHGAFACTLRVVSYML